MNLELQEKNVKLNSLRVRKTNGRSGEEEEKRGRRGMLTAAPKNQPSRS